MWEGQIIMSNQCTAQDEALTVCSSAQNQFSNSEEKPLLKNQPFKESFTVCDGIIHFGRNNYLCSM